MHVDARSSALVAVKLAVRLSPRCARLVAELHPSQVRQFTSCQLVVRVEDVSLCAVLAELAHLVALEPWERRAGVRSVENPLEIGADELVGVCEDR